MKKQNYYRFSDEICGKETEDYIEEFSPNRLTIPRFFEDSETIFNIDEEKTFVKT